MELNWLLQDVVLAMHDASLERFGGSSGIRDEGLLESALMRPQMLAHYKPGVSVRALAAAYAFGLTKNHPFVDGNKRTAFAAAYAFLRDNGFRLRASQADTAVVILAVSAGSISEEQLAQWFEANTQPSRS